MGRAEALGEESRCRNRTADRPAFGMWSVANDQEVPAVLCELTFENPSIGEVETENFALRAIGGGIELDERIVARC